MRRILFIAAHRPNRSPSQRFRFEQYISYLESQGFVCDYSWLLSAKDDELFYSSGHYISKAFIVLKSWIKRRKNLRKAGEYDIIFIQREAFMTGSTYFEKKFYQSGAKVIFDFDDAIWKLDISEANKNLSFLKRPGKTPKLIKAAHLVIAGNDYLAQYAEQFNPNVWIIPTTIDTNYHFPEEKKPRDYIVIGWTGSMTTIKHFRLAEEALLILKKKYGDKIRFKVIGDGSYSHPGLEIQGIPWTLENEVRDLNDIDIGIMPLSDDEWSRGKCGFKGLQYMAMEIAPVLSPVGVNTRIVQNGINGLLAGTTGEWVETLSLLIEDPQLRKSIGKAARKTVIEHYSVESQKEKYLAAIRSLLN